jgi:hypothetical protein
MKTFTLLLLFVVTTISCADENTEAKGWVKNLYAAYQKDFVAMSIVGPNADTIYCPELLKLAKLDQKLANGENGILDWDPLCDCQDPEGMRIDEIVVKKKNVFIYAELKFMISGTKMMLTLKLRKTGGKWLICDAISPTTPSLYEYLQKGIADLQKDSTDRK